MAEHWYRQRHVSRQIQSELLRATADAPPILVYTMPKVGSNSVYESLSWAEVPGPVIKIHYLSAENLSGNEPFVPRGIPTPSHYYIGRGVRRVLTRQDVPFRWKIITLVREPVARQISQFFQGNRNPRPTTTWLNANCRIVPELALEALNRRFHDPRASNHEQWWFTKELERVFGVDVCAQPFDKAAGHATYHGDNWDLLLMTLEKLSDNWGVVASEFIGLSKPPELIPSNVRAALGTRAYDWVRNRIRLERGVLERLYAEPSVRNFYDEETIEGWIHYWSRPSDQPVA